MPLIHRALVSACGPDGRGLTFVDLFAGSGVVSRLAKLMDFRVICNDWEEFARVINTAHVGCDASEARRLFPPPSDLPSLIRHLNSLAGAPPEGEYVARYYAPRSDDVEAADYRRERLFYTRRNALAIDRARGEIDRLFPPDATSPDRQKRRALLVAPLLYEAATHTNTSGVFKAFHKGFGGHGRDALGRILAPIVLEPPVLIDSTRPATVVAEDANLLARAPLLQNTAVDVAYLDPPYSQHQYGSNYHLLTSIARWDRLPAPLDMDERGSLRSKAGIRPDWTATRSAYCSRSSAEGALVDLVGALRARFILVSYSSEGIVPLERLLDICGSRGSVTVLTEEYTTYRGGRQSSTRVHRNMEFVLVVDTTRPATPASRRAAQLTLERRTVEILLKRRFVRSRMEERFPPVDAAGRFSVDLDGASVELQRHQDGTLGGAEAAHGLGLEGLIELGRRLEACVCADAEEEIAELLRAARARSPSDTVNWKQLLRLLRRLAHRKDRPSFDRWMEELRSLAREIPRTDAGMESDLDAIEAIARRRRQG